MRKTTEILKLWNDPAAVGIDPAAGEFEPFLEVAALPGCCGAPRGGVLVCPGGGYTHRAPHEGMPVAETFNALGFHAFVLQYRVAPARYPAPFQDVSRAIRLIRSRAAQWNLNPSQLAVLGFSAGGNLVGVAGTLPGRFDVCCGDAADRESSRPDAVISCYGVMTFADDCGGRRCGDALFPEPMAETVAELLSPIRQVTGESSPTFLWHTAEDPVVDVRNSVEFARALWKNGVTAELHVFPHGGHGLGLAPAAPDIVVWPELAKRFLVESCKFNNK